MRINKEELIMRIAEVVSERSTCKRLKVGSVLICNEMIQIKGYGYNGNYKGGPNKCDTNEPGNCGCIHSEVNCLIKAFNRQENDILFITDSPCLNCAKIIINSNIKKVYYRNDYRDNKGLKLLINNNIKIKKVINS